jgi:hypothetical protein
MVSAILVIGAGGISKEPGDGGIKKTACLPGNRPGKTADRERLDFGKNPPKTEVFGSPFLPILNV